MGSPNSKAYLASPAVVAYSAIQGYICGPQNYDSLQPKGEVLFVDQNPPPPEANTWC